jgi:hypothetical protein
MTIEARSWEELLAGLTPAEPKSRAYLEAFYGRCIEFNGAAPSNAKG